MSYVLLRPRPQVDMKLVILLLVVAGCRGDTVEETNTYVSRMVADLWLEGADVVRILWRDCSKKLVDVTDVIDHKEYFPKFIRCMKRKTLRALDRSLSTDVVPIADGVNLVRFELVDQTGKILPENDTRNFWTEEELEEGEWRTLALQRIARVLRTHVIKFDFDDKTMPAKVEYRGRRRHMMTMMMFGIVSIGMVLIPMGFQFLAVLGGKALILAKMALILASIQGLKKISASPLNYGFYHTSYPPPAPYEHFEKRSKDSKPYSHLEKRSSEWSSNSITAGAASPPWSSDADTYIKIDKKRLTLKKKSSELEGSQAQTISEARLYPVYNPEPTLTHFTSSIDAPTPLVDLTTNPVEVQADYSIDLPYNGLTFQDPTPIVSS